MRKGIEDPLSKEITNSLLSGVDFLRSNGYFGNPDVVILCVVVSLLLETETVK